MSALVAVAAALGLVGLGMLVSPEMSRIRARLRRRHAASEANKTAAETPTPTPGDPPTLRVIHGDGGTVVPFPPRQAEPFSATSSPYGVDGPDAA